MVKKGPHIDGLLLIDSQTLHQSQGLLVELSYGFGDFGHRADRLGGRHSAVCKPLVILDLVDGQPLGRIDDQHVPDQVLTFWTIKNRNGRVKIG